MIFLLLLLLASSVIAFPSSTLSKRTPCQGNTNATREKWCDHDITTNYYETTPEGALKEYWLRLEDMILEPDGRPRHVQVFNGSLPGPTIEANWGDTVRVHLTNACTNRTGTSIHFHGIQQKNTFQSDGVVSLTQCPVAPGDTITYEWKATQYGTSWYHSHYSLQAWDGAFGPILIHGPASENYDIDLGHVFINDSFNAAPPQENGLINGNNTYQFPNGTVVGKRAEIVFEPGKTHLLRLVNSAIEAQFNFTIEGHEMTVIAADFVPIEPYTTRSLSITMGQRYDILVKADQPVANYWIRAIPQSCVAFTDQSKDNIRAILKYSSDNATEPGPLGPLPSPACLDEAISNLKPIVKVSVDPPNFDNEPIHQVGFNASQINGIGRWNLGETYMITNWSYPSIQHAYEGNYSFVNESTEAAFLLPRADKWVYYFVRGLITSHPIHLHGHDFAILDSGVEYDENTVRTNVLNNLDNPPRRDVATLPAGTPSQNGYLVIGFKTDNPGIWLMHCHIGYHTFESFGVQFIERPDEIESLGLIDPETMNPTCDNWKAFNLTQGADSGF
ncbi:multicopper oxidase [Patellaria atrata CBS 101060]|uniref:Multicopper oxidase n=1 Tax=Patellaria atrata CBS 101060 TaxID=1346257 RepID=A0A9P4VTV8_9PEZI|nr:multicopper oxidase [Patellaria atrata CBS 101060]